MLPLLRIQAKLPDGKTNSKLDATIRRSPAQGLLTNTVKCTRTHPVPGDVMKPPGSEGEGGLCAIVLAAGQGSRLQGITTLGDEAVPKQFCALHGDVSMLRRTLQRAARLVPGPHIKVVVAAQHRKWWQRELADLGRTSIVEQPANRGTAAGVLLPLTPILRQDPEGVVVLLPADHHVGREWILQAALDQAVAAV